MPTPPPPAAPSGGPVAPAKPKLPGRAGIIIGIALIVVGIIGGIALVVSGARDLVEGIDELEYLSIEAGGTVQIDEPGTIAVYAIRDSFSSGGGFSTGGAYDGPPLAIAVTGPDGAGVPVSATTSSVTYQSSGVEGVQVATFGAEVPGAYRIEPVASGPLFGYDRLAVGPELDLGSLGGILAGVFGGGLLVVVGIIVLIISAVRRSRARRSLRPPTPYGGPPYGGAPAYGGGPYGGAPAYGGAAGWAPPPVAVPGSYGAPPPPAVPPAPPAAPPGYGPPPGSPPSPAPGGPPSAYVPPAPSTWPPPPEPAPGQPAGAPPGWVAPPAPPPADYGPPGSSPS